MKRRSRSFRILFFGALAVAMLTAPRASAQPSDAPQTTVAKAPNYPLDTDPFLWLEDVHGQRALDWVNAENAKTLAVLEHLPQYSELYHDALAIANSNDRIPYPTIVGSDVYNFWRDSTHVRGIWRRTTVDSYATTTPQWSTALDLDAVAKSESANWVWEGADCVLPAQTRCLVRLSDGGEDAQTVREFDLTTGQFVADGFQLPRGKQTTAWEDPNTLLVSREWNPGDVTASGYPYIVKRLVRGQPLSAATEIFRGTKTDVADDPGVVRDGDGHQLEIIGRALDFFNVEYHLVTPKGVVTTTLPAQINIAGLVANRLLFTLNQDWTVAGRTFAQGSLVSLELPALEADPMHLSPTLVYAPGPREEINNVSVTKSRVVMITYVNVRGRAFVLTPIAGGGWLSRQLDLPDDASISTVDTSTLTDTAYLIVDSFLLPTTLYSIDAVVGTVAQLHALPAQFDASNDVVEQHEATSKDGTQIPYFIVHPKSMQLDGTNPTVINAYGGFQLSQTPVYSGIYGKLWLERGGVFVLANIRGGGEFGPAWHEAGLKTHRQRIYDDFYAVAQDLVARKITTPRRLGIVGGSNGGLLMGVEFTQHPEMYDAVDIEVPLLDMLRYEQIEAGASWVGEYGSVSVPAERAFLASISPYNNLKPGVAYPEPFIWTTTKDDRVGPQHARKFAAKLASMDVKYLFYEVTEGGHGSGANLNETAHTDALEWTYFTWKLMGP